LLHRIESKIGTERFNLWFRNTELISASNGLIEIGVPSLFIGNWMREHFGEVVTEAAREVRGEPVEVKYRVVERLLRDSRPPRAKSAGHFESTKAQGIRLGAAVRSDFLLENFVVGPCNRFAHAAAMEIINSPNSAFNPLFLHGGVGLGKTHILQGIYNSLRRRGVRKKLAYVDAERFANEYVFALRNNKVKRFRDFYRNVDVLLIDDVHFLSSKMGFQEEFLHTYNSLDSANKQVVMASDSHPKFIGKLKDCLVNRFVSGMVIKLEPPDFKTRVAILKVKARRLRRTFKPEVLRYIADVFTGNVRELEGALTTVVAYAGLTGSDITLSLAREALDTISKVRRSKVRIENIERAVVSHFGISRNDLRSRRRTRSISLARQVAMYLARKLTKHSCKEIGDFFGGKNHSTVLFAEKKISSAREEDATTELMLQKLEQQATH